MPFAPVPVRISNRYFYDQPLSGPFEAVALPIHAGRNSHIVWARSQPHSLHARQTRICTQAVCVFALDADSLEVLAVQFAILQKNARGRQ